MKIGLIAMSGIRVCDSELLRLGLTLPGFVERSVQIASLPSLGLLTLAGMTPDRHDVEYLEVADLKESQKAGAIPDAYDLVAISSYSAQIGEAYALADWYRERGVPVVLGGLHVSCCPDEAGEHCDAVVVGEGELNWGDVVRDAEAGSLSRVYGNDGREYDLVDAPMPAYELLDIDKYNRLMVQTSRGCPFLCEFCASSILLTKRYKQKPIDKVIAEIDRIRALWEHPFIELADDNSFVNHAYWRELLPRLEGRRFRWFAETDLSVSRDAELLKLMREHGCAQVLIGFESPTQTALDGLETKSNWKSRQWAEYADVVHRVQSQGISVNGCFVVGLDDHDTGVFDRIIEFVETTGLHEVQITIQTAFPGTPLYRRLRDAGRLIDETAWETCTLFDINYRPGRMTVEELHAGFKRLATELYSEEMTRQRRERFKDDLRSGKTSQ